MEAVVSKTDAMSDTDTSSEESSPSRGPASEVGVACTPVVSDAIEASFDDEEETKPSINDDPDGYVPSEYEMKRLERIRRNKAYLAKLGLERSASSRSLLPTSEGDDGIKQRKKRRRKSEDDEGQRPARPARKSGRFEGREFDFNEDKLVRKVHKIEPVVKKKKKKVEKVEEQQASSSKIRMSAEVRKEYRRMEAERRHNVRTAERDLRAAEKEHRFAEHVADLHRKKKKREEESQLRRQKREDLRLFLANKEHFFQMQREQHAMKERALWQIQQQEAQEKMSLIDALERFPKAVMLAEFELDRMLLQATRSEAQRKRRQCQRKKVTAAASSSKKGAHAAASSEKKTSLKKGAGAVVSSEKKASPKKGACAAASSEKKASPKKRACAAASSEEKASPKKGACATASSEEKTSPKKGAGAAAFSEKKSSPKKGAGAAALSEKKPSQASSAKKLSPSKRKRAQKSPAGTSTDMKISPKSKSKTRASPTKQRKAESALVARMSSRAADANKRAESPDKKVASQSEPRRVGGPISFGFAKSIDRSWLEGESPVEPSANGLFVPQVGDTVLYYPAGHQSYLEQFPYLKQIPDLRARGWRLQTHQPPWQKEDWGQQWSDGWENSGLGTQGILCTVEASHPEFPPETYFKNVGSTMQEMPFLQSKGKTKAIPLQLCVKLKPLVPVTCRNTGVPGRENLISNNDASTPGPFSVIIFPSALPSFVVPFAWAFLKRTSISIGDRVKLQFDGGAWYKGTVKSIVLDDRMETDPIYHDSVPAADACFIRSNASNQLKHGSSIVSLQPNLDGACGDWPTWDGVAVTWDDGSECCVCAWELDRAMESAEGGRRSQQKKNAHSSIARVGNVRSFDEATHSALSAALWSISRMHKKAAPFVDPVTELSAPAYYCGVPVGMCLRKILKRLKLSPDRGNDNDSFEVNCYYRSVGAIISDLQEIYENCLLYNDPSSEIVKSAKELVVDAQKAVVQAKFAGHKVGKSIASFDRDWIAGFRPDGSWAAQEQEMMVKKKSTSSLKPWIPQANDKILYSKNRHEKFVAFHCRSLSPEQAKIAAGGDGQSEWLCGTIARIQYCLPPSEEGTPTFAEPTSLVALTVKFDVDVSNTSGKQIQTIYWRPCYVASENDKACPCGLSTFTSFVRPAWKGGAGVPSITRELQASFNPPGISPDMQTRVLRCLDMLRRRCLEGVPPDLIERKAWHTLKASSAMAQSTSFSYDSFNGDDVCGFDRMIAKVGGKHRAGEILCAVHFLSNKKDKLLASSAHPVPGLCLNLICLRIENGFYRHLEAAMNDAKEAFLLFCVHILGASATKFISSQKKKKKKKKECTEDSGKASIDPSTVDSTVLTEKEKALRARLESVRKLYATALVCLSEVGTAEKAFGFLHRLQQTAIQGADLICGSEKSESGKSLDHFISAIARDPCLNHQPIPRDQPNPTVKIRVILKDDFDAHDESYDGDGTPENIVDRILCPSPCDEDNPANNNTPVESMAAVDCKVPHLSNCNVQNPASSKTPKESLSQAAAMEPRSDDILVPHLSNCNVDNPASSNTAEESMSQAAAIEPSSDEIREPHLLNCNIEDTASDNLSRAVISRAVDELSGSDEAEAADPSSRNAEDSTCDKMSGNDGILDTSSPPPGEGADSAGDKMSEENIDLSQPILLEPQIYEGNPDIARAIFGVSGRREPCARCRLKGSTLIMCRIRKGHSNPDVDASEALKLLPPMLKQKTPLQPAQSSPAKGDHEGGVVSSSVNSLGRSNAGDVVADSPLSKLRHDDPLAADQGSLQHSGQGNLECTEELVPLDGVVLSKIPTLNDAEGNEPREGENATAVADNTTVDDGHQAVASNDCGMAATQIVADKGSKTGDVTGERCDGVLNENAASSGASKQDLVHDKECNSSDPLERTDHASTTRGEDNDTVHNIVDTVDQDGGNNKGPLHEEEVDPLDLLKKANLALQMARDALKSANAALEQPLALNDEFIRCFPVDEQDGHYTICHVCGFGGDMLICETCPYVAHANCYDLKEVPDGDWFCNRCSVKKLQPQQDSLTDQSDEITTCESSESPGAALDVLLSELRANRMKDKVEGKIHSKRKSPVGALDTNDEIGESRECILNDDIETEPAEEADRAVIAVGTKVLKTFQNFGDFEGTVVKTPTEDDPYFKVKYEDGDEEEMSEDEVWGHAQKMAQRVRAAKEDHRCGTVEVKKRKSKVKEKIQQVGMASGKKRGRGRPRKVRPQEVMEQVKYEDGDEDKMSTDEVCGHAPQMQEDLSCGGVRVECESYMKEIRQEDGPVPGKKRGRGRPRKVRQHDLTEQLKHEDDDKEQMPEDKVSGHAQKKAQRITVTQEDQSCENEEVKKHEPQVGHEGGPVPGKKRGRGRPRKVPPQEESEQVR